MGGSELQTTQVNDARLVNLLVCQGSVLLDSEMAYVLKKNLICSMALNPSMKQYVCVL